MSRFGSAIVAASLRATATPPFMSQEPSPYRSSPSRLAGRFEFAGTVSRWPAITTRSSRPRSVRATTVFPSRVSLRWRCSPSAFSTASAICASFRLTDSQSTNAVVRAMTSACRSRAVMELFHHNERAELVTFGIGQHRPLDFIISFAHDGRAPGHEFVDRGPVPDGDVPMDTVLHGFGFWDGCEVHRIERCARNLVDIGETALDMGDIGAQHCAPPVGDLSL